jgi:predicted RNA-binding protein YlxR (DUF448 family)
VGCRGRAAKRDLLRLRLEVASGRVAVDPPGGSGGRGAYVHRDHACVEAALRRGALAVARGLRLGGRLPREEVDRLRTRIEEVLAQA